MSAVLAAVTGLLPGLVGQVERLDTPSIDWWAVAPVAVLAGAAVLLLTAVALSTSRPLPGMYSVFTVVAAGLALLAAVPQWERVTDPDRGPYTAVAGAITVDGFTVFFTVLITMAIVLTTLLADGYLRREGLEGPELYVLMLLAGTGGIVMAMSNDLVVLFLGLETLSIALYVMAGFHLRRMASLEAGLKYFVLGAFSSAFLLYGIALVYGATGSTNFGDIATFLSTNVLIEPGLLLAGFALMLVGLGFKVAAAPFHVWTPDVYQGAPTPVTGFFASASKAAAFAALLRVFLSTFETYRLDWRPVMWALAVLSLLVGSFLAIVQSDVKRMLAYSSIAHAGYILVGAEAASDRGVAAALFYLLAYTFMILGSFGVVTVVARTGDTGHDLDDYAGLSSRRPLLALTFTVLLLAQAGVPLTSGFFAKWYVIGASVEAESYILAVIAMVAAVVSAFLYLRIIVAMYMSDDAATDRPAIRIPRPAAMSLAVALAVTVVLGVLPSAGVDFARDAVPVLIAAR